ncbi:UVR8 [Symbiodinium natans]|uniref:UVR8 protein n=1 Tax=Symbiodinium natans TaxID=878477 RepID=A0A812UGC4_9DINO|nr:UVR8 [Symbiodinium natans]
MGANLPPVDMGAGRTVVKMCPGASHSCAILDDESMKCWGLGTKDKLGFDPSGYGNSNAYAGDSSNEMGDFLPPVSFAGLLGDHRVLSCAPGDSFNCAILDHPSETSQLACFGSNSHGQLGRASSISQSAVPVAVDLGTGRRAVQASAGTFHACALLDNGAVKCWGGNNLGQLGAGTDSTTTPNIGKTAGDMGDNLPPVDLGANLRPGTLATAVVAGFHHTCAILEGGGVKCWGWNQPLKCRTSVFSAPAQLKCGDTIHETSFAETEPYCSIYGRYQQTGQPGTAPLDKVGDAGGEMGSSAAAARFGPKASPVPKATLCRMSACLLEPRLDDGTLHCWGGSPAFQSSRWVANTMRQFPVMSRGIYTNANLLRYNSQ